MTINIFDKLKRITGVIIAGNEILSSYLFQKLCSRVTISQLNNAFGGSCANIPLFSDDSTNTKQTWAQIWLPPPNRPGLIEGLVNKLALIPVDLSTPEGLDVMKTEYAPILNHHCSLYYIGIRGEQPNPAVEKGFLEIELPQEAGRMIVDNSDDENELLQVINNRGGFPELEEKINVLQNIIDYIENTEFEVGDYFFFKGGVTVMSVNGKKMRLPHRVAEIYNRISWEYRFDKDYIREFRGDELIEQIQELATEAIEKPRLGRKPATTEFYEKIKAGEWADLTIPHALNNSNSA